MTRCPWHRRVRLLHAAKFSAACGRQYRFLTSRYCPDLLRKVGGFLEAGPPRWRPVTGRELAETSYQLLDIANEYHLLAQHF